MGKVDGTRESIIDGAQAQKRLVRQGGSQAGYGGRHLV